MAATRKTNVYLTPAKNRWLKTVRRRRVARSVAVGASRRDDLSERAEELLAAPRRR